jgi:holo-[acyl-carrier protein] synthase
MEEISAILAIIPLQLFSYYVAKIWEGMSTSPGILQKALQWSNSLNIFGIGTDIIEVDRIKKASMRNKMFLEKIFTGAEIEYCRQKKNAYIHYASRFAAKESVFKSLGIKVNGYDFFREIEILNRDDGAPFVVLHGQMLAFFIKNN